MYKVYIRFFPKLLQCHNLERRLRNGLDRCFNAAATCRRIFGGVATH
nr:MAG TPA: hypothetical protein [Caudoviricetes sp.]